MRPKPSRGSAAVQAASGDADFKVIHYQPDRSRSVWCRRGVHARLAQPELEPDALRTVPDRIGWQISKRLIWKVLLAIGVSIFGAKSVFVPALREGPAGNRSQAYTAVGRELTASRRVHRRDGQAGKWCAQFVV